VLLDFWATWGDGCKTKISWYMEFQNKYKDKGLAVIGQLGRVPQKSRDDCSHNGPVCSEY
jgi:hypothetical protein